MEHSLTEKWKACPAVAHAFDRFNLLTFPSTTPLFWGKVKPALTTRSFVWYDASPKALKLADAACFHATKPPVKQFARARAEQVSELLDQFIRLIDFSMQRTRAASALPVLRPPVLRGGEERGTSLVVQAQEDVEAGSIPLASLGLREEHEYTASSVPRESTG